MQLVRGAEVGLEATPQSERANDINAISIKRSPTRRHEPAPQQLMGNYKNEKGRQPGRPFDCVGPILVEPEIHANQDSGLGSVVGAPVTAVLTNGSNWGDSEA